MEDNPLRHRSLKVNGRMVAVGSLFGVVGMGFYRHSKSTGYCLLLCYPSELHTSILLLKPSPTKSLNMKNQAGISLETLCSIASFHCAGKPKKKTNISLISL